MLRDLRKFPDGVYRNGEIVGRLQFPFTKLTHCIDAGCRTNADGSILHLAPCKACERRWVDQDGTKKTIYMRDYLQKSVYSYVPQWATRAEFRMAGLDFPADTAGSTAKITEE